MADRRAIPARRASVIFELRVINPDGSLARLSLAVDVLNNLPALFRNLPDNHYAIYLVQSETNLSRLVIEVFVRNGRLIDPATTAKAPGIGRRWKKRLPCPWASCPRRRWARPMLTATTPNRRLAGTKCRG